jgi:ABC-type branched-subunit amino acid transport system substrate-binding protein
MSRVRGLLAASVAILSAVACASGSSTGSTTNSTPFVIGVTLSYSGAFGTNGPAGAPAFAAARDHINATGGIRGRQVKIVFRDDQSDVNKTVLANQDLMDNQHVDAIWPENVTAFITASIPFITQHNLVSFDAGSFNDPQKGPYNFQIGVTKPEDVAADMAALTALPTAVSSSAQLKKIGVLTSNDASGQQFGTESDRQLPKSGFTETNKVLFTAGATDLTVQVGQLKAQNPDAILVHAFGADIATVMKAIRDTNWKNVIVMGDPGTTPFIDLQAVVPQEVQGQLYFPIYKAASREGTTADTPWIQSVLKNGPLLSLVIAGLDYDGLMWMRWAINKAGSSEGSKVKTVLEGVGKLSAKDLPQDLQFFTANPGYTATDHSCASADITDLYALSKVGPEINGTFPRVTTLKTNRP